MAVLQWCSSDEQLYFEGQQFNPHTLEWAKQDMPSPQSLENISAQNALLKFAKQKRLRGVPVAIIGPREATARECEIAEELGRAYAQHGLQLICGGKNGVMEAACKGHAAAGGLPVGILPDGEWQFANPYVAIPIATGIGPARNAIIARACLALVAIGGGVGTLSEMALGLQFERLVLAMENAPVVPNVPVVNTVDEAMKSIAERLLGV